MTSITFTVPPTCEFVSLSLSQVPNLPAPVWRAIVKSTPDYVDDRGHTMAFFSGVAEGPDPNSALAAAKASMLHRLEEEHQRRRRIWKEKEILDAQLKDRTERALEVDLGTLDLSSLGI